DKGLNKSSGLCHCQMDASAQSRWLLGSGEGTRTASRIVGEAIGALAGGERAPAQATGRGAAGQQAKCRAVFQGGTQEYAPAAGTQAGFGIRAACHTTGSQ